MAWYWWLLVGILIGWLLSTLIEWIWFRRKRMEVRDERVAELENALRASADMGATLSREDGTAAFSGAASAPAANRDVALEAPDLDAPSAKLGVLAASMNTAADLPDLDLPDVELPDLAMPDVSAELPDLAVAMPDTDLPDFDMPDMDLSDMDLPDVEMADVDLPDVDLDGAKIGLGGAALAAGAAISAEPTKVADELTDVEAPNLGSAAPANTNYPDDLTEILGIGRVYETRLYRAGIYTWDQVANMTVSALEEATEAIDAANAGDWPAQAQALALANNRMGARYHGPLPDKLSALKGLGEGAEQQLYQAGIFTYAQLAATTADDLAAALPTSRGDFVDWIAQAVALS